MKTLKRFSDGNTYEMEALDRAPHDSRQMPDGMRRQPINFIVARACRDLDGGRLTPRERSFVFQMVALGNRTPSHAQSTWLRAILAKLCGRAAA